MNNRHGRTVRSRYPLLLWCTLVLSLPCQASPVIERWTTSNGIQVLFVAAPEIPMVKLRVVFAAGSAADESTPGISILTNALLDEGTDRLSADEFHARLEDTGADMGAGVTRDMAWLGLQCLTAPELAAPATALMRAALLKPRFATGDFSRVRKQMLAGLRQEQGSPRALAMRAMHQALYGHHPYAMPENGTEASVTALAPPMVAAFHQRYYVSENALVVMVGALTHQAAVQMAESLVGGLPHGVPAPALPAVPVLTEGVFRRVDFPGEQSHVIYAQLGISRLDPDYFPLVVGNHVLGGNGAVSLLFDEIREKRGLSYSVDSYFEPMAAAGPFVVSLQTDFHQETEARKVLETILSRFLSDGPTEAALEAAKRNLMGGFPLRIESNGKLLEYLTVIGFYHLPPDYLDTYTRAVEKVTRTQVREAFQRRIQMSRMAKITVGRSLSSP